MIQDVRGTGHSEGICDPAGHQDEDGYDTIEAIAKMPWCDGNVAMMGESYHGFSQLACARANPPHLKAICPFMSFSCENFGGSRMHTVSICHLNFAYS